MNKFQINQWGWITNVSIAHNPPEMIRAPDLRRPGRWVDIGEIGGGIGTVEFTGNAPATPEIIEAILRWAKNGSPQFPNWKEEWMCLYCGTPQPLPNRNCDKCGAPRNWLIG